MKVFIHQGKRAVEFVELYLSRMCVYAHSHIRNPGRWVSKCSSPENEIKWFVQVA